jgi:hypothetical protein
VVPERTIEHPDRLAELWNHFMMLSISPCRSVRENTRNLKHSSRSGTRTTGFWSMSKTDPSIFSSWVFVRPLTWAWRCELREPFGSSWMRRVRSSPSLSNRHADAIAYETRQRNLRIFAGYVPSD